MRTHPGRRFKDRNQRTHELVGQKEPTPVVPHPVRRERERGRVAGGRGRRGEADGREQGFGGGGDRGETHVPHGKRHEGEEEQASECMHLEMRLRPELMVVVDGRGRWKSGNGEMKKEEEADVRTDGSKRGERLDA